MKFSNFYNLAIIILIVSSQSYGQDMHGYCAEGTVSWTPNDIYIIDDDIVIDKNTGLSWKRCAEGMKWNGASCSGTAEEMNWHQAVSKYKISGSDWRLPSKDELTSLLSGDGISGCTEPALNPIMFPDYEENRWFWTSSSDSNDASRAWHVRFNVPRVQVGGKRSYMYIRLVKSTP